MRHHLVILCIAVFTSTLVFGQVLEAPRAWSTENQAKGNGTQTYISGRKAIPYQHVREADVMYSTRIWRKIDLRERVNHPFKFPNTPQRDRISFNDIIMNIAMSPDFQVYRDEDFQEPLTKEELKVRLSDTCNMPPPDPPIINMYDVYSIVQYYIIEDWFFDKQRSVMDVRIIAIAPSFNAFVSDPNGCTKEFKAGVTEEKFWIYFPFLRNTLAKHLAYNLQNTSARMSWDDLFFKRLFGSYIVKEENVYDRSINMYKIGLDALLEAEAIKERIFNYEQDLWEF